VKENDWSRYPAADVDRAIQTYYANLEARARRGSVWSPWASAVSVASGVGRRVGTTGNYAWRSTLNQLEDPPQALFDRATGTKFLSDLHAAWAIGTGATISDQNCVDDAVCFVGGLSIAEIGPNGSITALGTTIHSGNGPLRAEQGLHEGQHVQDFQTFGALGFLGPYVAQSATGTGYSDLWFERRAQHTASTGERSRDFTGRAAHTIASLWPFS